MQATYPFSLKTIGLSLKTVLSLGVTICTLACLVQSTDATELQPELRNPLWENLPLPTGPSETPGQFGSVGQTSSGAARNNSPLLGDIEDDLPSNGGSILSRSLFGSSFSGSIPDYFIGDLIALPIESFTDEFGDTIPLRRQPLVPGETISYRDEDNVIQEFTYLSEEAFTPFYWSPHKDIRVETDGEGNPIGDFETQTEDLANSRLLSGAIFASEPGRVDVYWRSDLPLEVIEGLPVYALVKRSVTVSAGTSKPARKIYWTESGFSGPTVSIPRGAVQQVKVIYNRFVPKIVPDEEIFVPEGVSSSNDTNTVPLPNRTLWYDNTLGELKAYNKEGRVLVEYLGLPKDSSIPDIREHIGFEIVEIVREARPLNVTTNLGDRILPSPDGLNLITDPLELDSLTPIQVLNPQNLSTQFVRTFILRNKSALFAERITSYTSDVQVYWKEPALEGVEWPVYLNSYSLVWPDDLSQYAVNVRPSDEESIGNTLPIFPESGSKELIFQDDLDGNQAKLNENLEFEVTIDSDDPQNRSLILLQSGSRFWYVRVESVLDMEIENNDRYSDYKYLVDAEEMDLVATVGQRIKPPPGADTIAGYIDASRGTAYNINAYKNPFSVGIAAAEESAIIPINATPRKAGQSNNQLVVWWFKKMDPPSNAEENFTAIYWPSIVARYQLEWPDDAPEIVLAEGRGSGSLVAPQVNGSLYIQNDPTQDGYNPNEEHALFLAGSIYALRDDLNHPDDTSKPYTLFEYTSNDGRPSMLIHKVIRENGDHTFEYNAIAGLPLAPPAPLSLLPPPINSDGFSRNTEITPDTIDPALNPPEGGLEGSVLRYNKFTFEDRKGLKWLYRGPHQAPTPGNRPALQMRWYYNTLPTFAFPEKETGVDEAPTLGTIVPFLRPLVNQNDIAEGYEGDPVAGSSVILNYLPFWPDDPGLGALEKVELPVLNFAESLAKPKFGLPNVIDQSSLQILYQQSVAMDVALNRQSAVLHDFVRRKKFFLNENQLDAFRGSAESNQYRGNTYFQNLPPHLQERLFLDPNEGSHGALVFEGEFVDAPVGESYLLLNTLSSTEVELLKDLVAVDNSNKSDWDDAIDGLFTVVETFQADPSDASGRSKVVEADVDFLIDELPEVVDEDSAVASYALTAVGGGEGYLTLVASNGEVFTDQNEKVTMHIIKVGERLYTGEVKPLTPANPLGEQVTMLHTGDFAANEDRFDFQWRYSPPVNGQPPANTPTEPGTAWIPLSGDGPKAIFGGGAQPLLTMSDNYVTVRYRPKEGHTLYPDGGYASENNGWSDWTDAALAEGWIKRVLAGINPFNQRITDFFNNQVNTDTSVLTQAGRRWEGDVPLTLEAAQDAGLIEIYETVLKRGIGLSIDGNPAVDYGPANDALLLASGYLADLYMALGNEAYADASNPTIIFDASSQALNNDIAVIDEDFFRSTSTSRFSFEGQVPNLLEEELSLLRGRDDFFAPGVEASPVYNRLFWNYTRGIDAGEVFYALNYNIREKTDENADGRIDAEDALRLYPQGHGDAYGHYLTATKNYYRLLTDEQFTWVPRIEAVNILGKPITVDYLDERRFARAAASLSKTAAQIVNLEQRRVYEEDSKRGWSHLRDGRENPTTGTTRHWGLDEWASRGGQSAYLNWAVTNALLPEEVPDAEGVQKIDRTTVPELDELALTMRRIQNSADEANARVNPLGLTPGSMVFDISPAEIEEGVTHFEQIFKRATRALGNASTVFQKATESTKLLRSVENQSDLLSKVAFDQEFAFNVKLIDLLGTPYSGDLGPGKPYSQDYEGPDTERFMYIDLPYSFIDRFNDEEEFTLSLPQTTAQDTTIVTSNSNEDEDETYLNNFSTFFLIGGAEITDFEALEPEQLERLETLANPSDGETTYTINPSSLAQTYLPGENGRRKEIGEVQEVLLRWLEARDALLHAYEQSENQKAVLEAKLATYKEMLYYHETYETIFIDANIEKAIANRIKDAAFIGQEVIKASEEKKKELLQVALAALPAVIGLANDPSFSGRLTIGLSGFTISTALKVAKYGALFTEKVAAGKVGIIDDQLPHALKEAGFGLESVRTATEFVEAYRDYTKTFDELNAAAFEMAAHANSFQSLLNDAEDIMVEREIFRKRVAAVAQGYRTRDVGFRAFRTEALEEYQSLLDWSARYAFLAAKAYDYETGLLGSEAGQEFLNEIVASRALGIVGEDGQPQFAGSSGGDPGLSSLLAKLSADWEVVEGRLGFNNPDTYGTLFSLRREHFRLPYLENGSDEDHIPWQETLQTHVMDDLRTDPDIAAYALQLNDQVGEAVPGIVIPFSTTIQDGLNFFGNSLIAGDSQFTPTSFATKIHSLGIVFDGYKGMPPCLICGDSTTDTTHDDPNALSATPYVYLIPTGRDFMRAPALGDQNLIRSWKVHDNALPLPHNIGSSEFSDTKFWTGASSLSEDFFTPRKHQAFRATNQASFFFTNLTDDYTNSRLIGRSAWNTEWKLVIPADTLLAETEEGIDRFIRSIKDIKIYLRTYSYSGN